MTTRNSQTPEVTRDQDLQQIREALRGLRYGSVHVVVQDGHVIQIDRTEKSRRSKAATISHDAENC